MARSLGLASRLCAERNSVTVYWTRWQREVGAPNTRAANLPCLQLVVPTFEWMLSPKLILASALCQPIPASSVC